MKKTTKNWSEMNRDTLSLIIKMIKNPSDHIRISVVCSSWRSIVKESRCTLSHSIPGLLVSLRNNPFHIHSLTSLFVTTPFLYNPFIKRCHLLPNMPKKDVGKALLSSSPYLDELKCVVLILFETRGATFCKLGDVSWTKLLSLYNEECFSDALFCNERFYVVDDHGEIYTCNLDQELITEISSQPSDISKRAHKFNLVELKGQLCRVLRKFAYSIESIYSDDDEEEDTKAGSSDMTRVFRVWAMEPGKGKWVEKKNIGECALFLGKNNSISLSEFEVKGIRGNKVYFTDDRQKIKDFGCICPGEDMGIYDFGDSRIDPLCSIQCQWWTNPPAIWVVPLPR